MVTALLSKSMFHLVRQLGFRGNRRSVSSPCAFGDNEASTAEMNQLYDLVIKPAIEANSLSPYLVKRDRGADKLDDAIMEGIDRSVLVVVDLTHDRKTGLRGSVIFEAGYAYKSKPIIWMCRDDLADFTPFDVDHLRQIRWNQNKLIEAREELVGVIDKRIKGLQLKGRNHEIRTLVADKWKAILECKDIHLENGESYPAHVSRLIILEELCDDLETRVKYKEMGLSQDQKYELIELVRRSDNL